MYVFTPLTYDIVDTFQIFSTLTPPTHGVLFTKYEKDREPSVSAAFLSATENFAF